MSVLTKLGIEINPKEEYQKAQQEMIEISERMSTLSDMMEFQRIYEALSDYGKIAFLELANVKGCKPYHLEGSALVHTWLVFQEMSKAKEPEDDELLLTIAFLHDIGKVYTGRPRKDDSESWEYPNHSNVGANVLPKFVKWEENDPRLLICQWFIRNHIKPLFWQKYKRKDISPIPKVEDSEAQTRINKVCTIRNLARLALCDVKGSISSEPQNELKEYLSDVIFYSK